MVFDTVFGLLKLISFCLAPGAGSVAELAFKIIGYI
jgi:hypothetical protein